MTIEQIETFLTISETNSITAAANRLFISQSTVSHRINSLEKELGFSLLSRTRGERFVSLTLRGEEFIEIAKRWKALWSETNLWKGQQSKMNIRVAGVDSINTSIFSAFYKKIINEKNDFSINIGTHWSKTIYELVENYDIDTGFVLTPLKHPNVILKELFKGRGVLVSLEDSKYPSLVHPKDLKLSDEILFSSMPNYDMWHNIWWKEDRNECSSVDTTSLLFNLLDSKDQWVIVPIWIARSFEKKYPLKISELSVTPPEYFCYQISNKHPRPSKLRVIELFNEKLKVFLEKDTFKENVK